MTLTLNKNNRGRSGPLVFVVMDGVGVGCGDDGDAVAQARTPVLDALRVQASFRTLKAHGRAVGLPSDGDMGNSEVGHNAIGAGRIIDQGALLVNQAIESGAIFDTEAWRDIVRRGRAAGTEVTGGALHLIGLLSDGNVHSHERHLHALLRRADVDGLKTVYVHALLDGRDVSETSALIYIDRLQSVLTEIEAKGDRRYKIASGGGRMTTTMDRYEADWSIVERGWSAQVHGQGREFSSAREAIETYRCQAPVIDQNLPAFVVSERGSPIGAMKDGDSVVFFNFRGDRALEVSRAFEEGDGFAKFDRGVRPKVAFAGMTLYDGDLNIPKRYLVPPPAIDRTMGEYLAGAGVRQYAISETQKYGHVTYFWNGNRGGKFDDALETYVEITSDRVSFDERPWMKAAEITDATIEAVESGHYDFIRLNYANGDMVGHTGILESTKIAVECVDLCLGRLWKAVTKAGGTLIVTADHGNADDMYERDKQGRPKTKADGTKKALTSHTLAPVPLYLHPQVELRDDLPGAGLANLAATILELLGYDAPEGYEPGLIKTA